MQIVVIAGGADQKQFQDKEIPEGVTIQFVTTIEEAKEDADGYFYLLGENSMQNDLEKMKDLQAPVFVTEHPGGGLSDNLAIIEGWPEFLAEEVITVHTPTKNMETVSSILNGLQWKFTYSK